MGMEESALKPEELIKKLAVAKSMDKKPPKSAAEIRREMLEWLARGRKSA